MYMYGDSHFNGPSSNIGGIHDGGGGGRGGGTNNVMDSMNEQEAVALLQHLDKSELEHLLNNDAKLQELVSDLSQVRNLQMRHDNLVATNKSLAEYNLSQRPRLEDLRRDVASQYQRLNELKTSLAEGKTQLDTFVGNQRMDAVLAVLQTATAETEEKSEELADKFCEDGDIDSFLSEFLSQRALAHQRRIKSEKFAELLQKGRQTSGFSSSASTSALTQPPASLSSMSLSSSTPVLQSHNNFYQNSAPYPASSGHGMPVFPR